MSRFPAPIYCTLGIQLCLVWDKCCVRVAPMRAPILLALMGVSRPIYNWFISNGTILILLSVIMLSRHMYIIIHGPNKRNSVCLSVAVRPSTAIRELPTSARQGVVCSYAWLSSQPCSANAECTLVMAVTTAHDDNNAIHCRYTTE